MGKVSDDLVLGLVILDQPQLGPVAMPVDYVERRSAVNGERIPANTWLTEGWGDHSSRAVEVGGTAPAYGSAQ